MTAKCCTTLGFWKLSPRLSKSSPRRGCCVRQLGRVGRTSAGRQDELSDRRLAADPNGRAHVLCWKVVKHATKPNNLSRSRLWSQLAPGCVDCTSFVSSRRAELGETRRARPISVPLLLRVSSPPLVLHPTALLTQSPRVAAPRRRSRECHACRSSRAYRCPCV